MKVMELQAFLCVGCLLAVEKDGMARVSADKPPIKAKTPIRRSAFTGKKPIIPQK
jgi:hypothetical protein